MFKALAHSLKETGLFPYLLGLLDAVKAGFFAESFTKAYLCHCFSLHGSGPQLWGRLFLNFKKNYSTHFRRICVHMVPAS